jgi:arginine utilization protein RocB
MNHPASRAIDRDNVVATIPGTDPSRRIVLVAHYDTVLTNPGAGDNAAGVATLIEAGRALTQSDLVQARLYTFNVGDFMHLHGEYMSAGQAHAGIIFGDQQRFGVGEQMRRLLRIISLRTAEELRSRCEFHSAWQ